MKTPILPKAVLGILIVGACLIGALVWKQTSRESISPQPDTATTVLEPEQEAPEPVSPAFSYIEVMKGCNAHFAGPCVNVRSGPGTSFPKIAQLRIGMVLKVAEKVKDTEGNTWYKIAFDEWIRYPERVTSDWYVSADVVRLFSDEGDLGSLMVKSPPNAKRIVIDISEQVLYAYDSDTLYMQSPISTGVDLSPTPIGTFSVRSKTPRRYMQGPIPEVSDQYYDLPGVPWDLYFTELGAAIHGAYWHTDFGKTHSHGCVNLPLDQAQKLYRWADLGTKVSIRN